MTYSSPELRGGFSEEGERVGARPAWGLGVSGLLRGGVTSFKSGRAEA